MGRHDRARLKRALRDHYRAQNAALSADVPTAVVWGLAARAAKAATRAADRPPLPAFVLSQVRYVRWPVWAVYAAVLAASCAAAPLFGDSRRGLLALSFAGASLGMAFLAGVVGSKAHRMAELEASCLFNAQAVALARLVAVGGAGLAVLALCTVALSAELSFVRAVGRAFAPFFASCAGGMLVARRLSSADALAGAVAWAVVVCGTSVVLCAASPFAASAASTGVWTGAAFLCGVWCVREAACWVRGLACPVTVARRRASVR